MDNRLDLVLERIGVRYGDKVAGGARHYLEVSIGDHAKALGYADLSGKYRNVYAVVPLKKPEPGMKVRIDGRTFVNYEQYSPGIAVPGYIARQTALTFKPYVALDSMICNFT